MKKNINIEKRQNEIYQKMSARKKLAILNMFYETGKMLQGLNNERKNSKRNFGLNRQNSR